MTIEIEDRLRQAGLEQTSSAVVPAEVVRAVNRRRRRGHSISFAVISLVVAAGVVAGVDRTGVPANQRLTVAATPNESVTQIVRDFLPGATTSIRKHVPLHPGTGLLIHLPAQDALPGPNTTRVRFEKYDLQWRAQVAACLVALKVPAVKTWVMYAAPVKGRAVGTFHGGAGFGTAYNDPPIDSISLAEATRQLQSNVATLFAALPSDADPTDTITSYSAPAGSNRFALGVHITVANAQTLNEKFGDVSPGLETGLVGSVTGDLIEGFAVVVTTPNGAPIYGGWSSSRGQSGSVDVVEQSQRSQTFATTTKFPNLTGGPTAQFMMLG